MKDRFTDHLILDGKATPGLLKLCAYGQLPELASMELWRDDAARGCAVWQAVSAALPPYWKARANAIDVTALTRAAGPEPEAPNFATRVRQRIEGVRR